MSHLIEEYSKNLGVKISKPLVSKHFWPMVPDKYVTICADSQIPSKNYKHYNLVINLIKESLAKRSIKIIQIGTSSSLNLQNVDQQLFDLPFKNMAYIISKSMLHIGVDNVFSHYASSIETPMVTIFGNIYETVGNGYWSKNQIKIEAPWKVKPCLSGNDSEDSINKINPEEIAKKILDQLKIQDKINVKTKFIGRFYDNQVIELVPDFFSPIEKIKNQHVFIRPDYGFDEPSFMNWCNYLQSYSIFANKELDLQFCSHFASKIKNISYILHKDSAVSLDHLEKIQNLNIGITILCEKEEDLPEMRERYFDFSVHLYYKPNKKILGDDIKFDNLFFNSSKIILSKGNQYSSKYHFLNQQKDVDKNFNLEDNDVLLEELEHFYIYERTK